MRLKYASLQCSVSQKNSLHHMVFSCLLKTYGPNLQNDTKLETTSSSIAKKMALDEPLLCTESLWEAFSGVNPAADHMRISCNAPQSDTNMGTSTQLLITY